MTTTTTTATTTNTLIFVRNWLTQLLDTLSDDQMLHQPVPGGNHAVWILGHLAWCDDTFAHELGGAESSIPAAWKDLFGFGSEPTSDASRYPSLDELKRAFEETRGKLMAWAEGMDEAKLSEPLPDDWKSFAPTYGAVVHTMAAHEAMHVGQLSVIRKSLGMKPAMM